MRVGFESNSGGNGSKIPSCFEEGIKTVLGIFKGLGPRCGGSEVIPFDSQNKSSWVRVGLVVSALILGLAFLVMGILALSIASSGPLVGITTGLVLGCSLGSMVLGVLLLSFCCDWSLKLCGRRFPLGIASVPNKEGDATKTAPEIKDPVERSGPRPFVQVLGSIPEEGSSRGNPFSDSEEVQEADTQSFEDVSTQN